MSCVTFIVVRSSYVLMQMFMHAFVISGIPKRNVTKDLRCSDTVGGHSIWVDLVVRLVITFFFGLVEMDWSMAAGVKLQPVNVYCDMYKYIYFEN